MNSPTPKSHLLAGLLLLFCSVSFPASALRAEPASGEPAEPEAPSPIAITADFVDQLLVEAQGHNPSLAAAGARADAASAGIDSVRIWEDPMFTLGYWKSTSKGFETSQEGDIIYGIEQKLPIFGRPELARHVAEAEAAREQLKVGYETQKIRRDLTVALAGLALADQNVTLTQEDLSWLEAISNEVNHRYTVGKASQVEWLKIQTERAKVTDHLKTLKLERDHKQVELNRLLNRDLHSTWSQMILPSAQAPVAYSDELVSAAIQAEPELKIMQQEVVENEAAAQATKRQRLPEIGVGLEGRQYSGDGQFREGTITVNFSLPWLNSKRYDSDFQRDRARVRAAEQDAADRTLTIREGIHHMVIDLDAARRQALLYRDELIPLTEQTLASASAAWENNLGSFQDVLEARRMLVDNRLMLAQALADQVGRLAELSLFIGGKDPAAFAQPVASADNLMTMPGESK